MAVVAGENFAEPQVTMREWLNAKIMRNQGKPAGLRYGSVGYGGGPADTGDAHSSHQDTTEHHHRNNHPAQECGGQA